MPDTAEGADAQPSVDGWMNARERLIYGWLVDLQDPSCKPTIEISVGGRSVGLARADRFHEGVQAKHGGDGRYRFSFYYEGLIEGGALEVAAYEAESRTPLPTKGPQVVTESKRSGPPLTIESIRVGEKVELVGRVGAYPGNSVELELWHDAGRAETLIPVPALEKGSNRFSAEIPNGLMHDFFSAEAELALPGMKEAGLAVPLRELAYASVAYRNGAILIELSEGIIVNEGVALSARFSSSTSPAVELPLGTTSNKMIVPAPSGFTLSKETFQVLLGDVPLLLRFRQELLRDLRFRSLGSPESPWRLSVGATGEHSFFAFPRNLSDHLSLSGDIARITNSSGSRSINLSQAIGDTGESLVAVIRANPGTKLVARLIDQTGIRVEESTTAEGDSSWNVFKLETSQIEAVAGESFFEIEASGGDVKTMEVAIATSQETVAPAEPNADNLAANPKLELWPEGVGLRRHVSKGEIASGWRFSNEDCTTPVWTRAVQDPISGAFGLAIAAPEVPKRLDIETDFQSAVLSKHLLIRFRAGVPPAARQLLAKQKSPVPQSALIERIRLVRRTVINAGSSSEVREKLIAQETRKVAISAEGRKYEIPLTVNLKRKVNDGSERGEETYHLAFVFNRPMAVALFDLEVLPQDNTAAEEVAPNFGLEDPNIELQVPKLVGLEAWISDRTIQHSAQHESRAPMKWSVAGTREPVEIIIPVFNALNETLACLESLATSTRVPLLVRLIDDGSDQPVRATLRSYTHDKPWVELHSLESNRGYTYAADFGVRSAQTEWVVLLNSDTILTRGWLEGLQACARSDSNIAFVGPLSNAATFQSVPELHNASGKWKVNTLPKGMTADDMADVVRSVSLTAYPEVPLLNGFCTLMRRSTFVELGGLNTKAFPAGYGEENDLCLRASKAGYKMAVADDVYVYHVKSASFGHARRDELSKRGTAALRALHPDVDLGILTKRFRDTLPLVTIRERLSRELASRTIDAVGLGETSQHEPPQAATVEQPLTQENQKA